jgi:hypothetical protein
MSANEHSGFEGIPVLLSAALPEELRGTHRALDLQQLLVALLRGLLTGGGRLVFGGHPSVTPLIHRIASEAGFSVPSIELYQLTRFREEAPEEIYAPTFSLHWVDAAELSTMRDEMAERSAAALFVGGKTSGYTGPRPGIRDEYERFLAFHPQGPVYLLGLLDGEALRMIHEMEEAGQREPNGLSPAELRLLHQTTDVDVAVSLVLTDLRRVFGVSPAVAPSTAKRRRVGAV